MNTHVAWLISNSWRSLARGAVLGLLPVMASPMVWAQTETATPGANARRQDLRSVVRQPAATPTPAGDKAVEPRHLTVQERSELRRQLTRELRTQNAALLDASRP